MIYFDRQSLLTQTHSLTVRTITVGEIAIEVILLPSVAVVVISLQLGQDAMKRCGCHRSIAIMNGQINRRLLAMQQSMTNGLINLSPWRGGGNGVVGDESVLELAVSSVKSFELPRSDGIIFNGAVFIGNHPQGVKHFLHPQPTAMTTRTVGAIE